MTTPREGDEEVHGLRRQGQGRVPGGLDKARVAVANAQDVADPVAMPQHHARRGLAVGADVSSSLLSEFNPRSALPYR